MEHNQGNWKCEACQSWVNGYCFEHMFNMKAWEVCPDWNGIWEDI